MSTGTDPQYPIGPFGFRPDITQEDREAYIEAIAAAPAALREACKGLTQDQLDTPYREGGWTVRQVIHHLFDSHANAWIRFRLALTEDHPRVTAYNEADWAELADTFVTPVEISIDLLEGLHRRWVDLLGSLQESQWQRTLDHPEHGSMTLDMLLQNYAWHGAHHIGHITHLRQERGW